MPKIDEYSPQQGAPATLQNSLQSGESFGAGVAQADQRLSDVQTGVVAGTATLVSDTITNAVASREEARLHNEMAEKHAKYTARIADILKNGDPNDTEIASRLAVEYDNDLATVSDSIVTARGRQFFENTNSTLKRNVVENVKAAQAELAGVAIKKAMTEGNEKLKAAVYLNPGSYLETKKFLGDGIDTVMKGKVKYEELEKFREKAHHDLAKSAIRGLIQINAFDAKRSLGNGDWDLEITGEMRKTLMAEAHQKTKDDDAEARRIKQAAKDKLEEDQKTVEVGFLQRLEKGHPEPLTPHEITHSILNPTRMIAIQNLLNKKINGEDVPINWPKVNDYYARIFLPEGHPRKINDVQVFVDAATRGEIRADKANFLIQQFQGSRNTEGMYRGQRMNDFIESMKQTVQGTGYLAKRDNGRDARYGEFKMWVSRKFEERVRQGKDTFPLTNPNSPEYLLYEMTPFLPKPDEIRKQARQMNNPELPKPVSEKIKEPLPTIDEIKNYNKTQLELFDRRVKAGEVPYELEIEAHRRFNLLYKDSGMDPTRELQ